ncbi:hypothetical protein T484DRAFT_1819482 [Baffinella frigidus]|nr:hypothetical protein T484DRAFT_1819482 [Cryptophyta sp. CCMP2293]
MDRFPKALVNDTERLYASLLAVSGAMVFAYCVGSISLLASQSNETETAIQYQIRLITDFLQARWQE